ncbi:flagellar export chaperone FliS [Acidicapsa dinghuensis]|uniref:Flagellar export chaperone FliS n=1 Tax=Acidicapsa dinghuensis TaxID=2218256 RepID=A0ABW1EKM5_9BACT|nr:flagellar export chaperone FliS [Acidicapsa dinghuensis]
MTSYKDHMLDGASPVDLVVALYDGIIRFLYDAIDAVEHADITARRASVKRALAIVIHLQTRLRMDIGGRPAQVLAEFYASIFALILQASVAADVQRFNRAIVCVREMRNAWRQIALQSAQPPATTAINTSRAFTTPATNIPESDASSRWTA